MKLSKLLRNYQPTPSSTRRARLEVQTLERRENPAGVVNVTFTGSVITLTGDGNPAGNNVQVSATGNDTTPNTSHFLFTGQLGTQFTVNGGAVQGDFDTSTVAGFAFPNNGTTKLNVNLAGPGTIVLIIKVPRAPQFSRDGLTT